MKLRESIIRDYFNAWINNNKSILKSIFCENIIYSECYGPEYHGLNQILLWFSEWHKHGKVLKWDIHQFIHSGNMVVVEWYFKCEYDGKTDNFNGVSIIEFTPDSKIKSLKEYESKSEHIYPYENQ